MTWALSTDEVREAYILAADTTNADRDNGEDFDHWLSGVVRKAQAEAAGTRWFTAAYRARNGNLIPIGVENTMRSEAEYVVEEFRREDPDGPEYFVASRIQPPWTPVEQNSEGNET